MKIANNGNNGSVAKPKAANTSVAPVSLEKKKEVFQYNEANVKISRKFYRFLELSLHLPYDIKFGTNMVTMSLSLDSYDKTNIKFLTAKFVKSLDSITFILNKKGFKINVNGKGMVAYTDDMIYETFINRIKSVQKRRSVEIFNSVIDDVMNVTPVGREYKIISVLDEN